MLSIDFGTSTTVAVVRWPDGRARPLLFDGSPLLESAVAAGTDGTILVGSDAHRAGRTRPGRVEPHLKQQLGAVWTEERSDEGRWRAGEARARASAASASQLGPGRICLDDHDVSVEELIAALLARVGAEATRTLGGPPRTVVLTHPGGWEPARRAVLVAAARRAGLGEPVLVPEPVAAAAYLATLLGGQVRAGAHVLVYDLGGGTFDAAVLRRTPHGFELIAGAARTDVGGLDVDAALVDWIGHLHAGDETWRRIAGPTDGASRRAWWTLWQDVRSAKEVLSRADSTAVHLPGVDRDLPISRDVLDRAAAPVVEATLDVTVGVLRTARLAPAQLTALFAVGGSSRLPLVPSALRHAIGLVPTVTEQPELVVAEGALFAVLANAPRPPVHLYRPSAGGAVGRTGALPVR
jgi:molecular chaperone DnaK (HSP70)